MATQKRTKAEDIELRPDGWQRFETAVDAAVRAGPKHRAVPAMKRTMGKGRLKAGKSKKQSA